MILGWSEHRPGEVNVRLIRREITPRVRAHSQEIWQRSRLRPHAGIQAVDGQWVFQGVGGWIS